MLSQTVPCISFPINKHPISQKHHLLWQKFTDLNFSIHWNHTTKAQTHLVCKPWGSFAVNIHNSVQIVLFCHTSGRLPLPCLPTMLHYTIHAKEHTSSILGSLLILEQSRSHRAWISILIRNRVPPIFKQQPWLTISNTWQTALISPSSTPDHRIFFTPLTCNNQTSSKNRNSSEIFASSCA